MADGQYRIPTALVTPMTVCLLTLDELCGLLVPMLLGFVTDKEVQGLVIGIGLVIALRLLKGGRDSDSLRHMAYWYLPPLFHFKKLPPSHCRRLRG